MVDKDDNYGTKKEDIVKISGLTDIAEQVSDLPQEPEIEIEKCVIHRWEKQTSGREFGCDYWDCSHKIHAGDVYYIELYPDGHVMKYCLECAAFFMTQGVDLLVRNWKKD